MTSIPDLDDFTLGELDPDRRATDVTRHLNFDFMAQIKENDANTLVKLLARVGEEAYRRGFQKGASVGMREPDRLPRDLHVWRYGTPLDISPWGDSPQAEEAEHRLMAECTELWGKSGPFWGIVCRDAAEFERRKAEQPE
ncbi:hypothetical protein V474_22780 [Novosphingobium barchaimii LL02]|uniref:Uncharacterized protein n=1 Tax=Novosphingobium barchaimii LL02 TaxID=1114963 RepID=A0A0J7XRD7_9SPHN|nr:hypothetical protein [Novosphingobium barchaimii]KMS53608.1 hypothetical protein V474_22780 [Novosphingobium barchaimii LL02]